MDLHALILKIKQKDELKGISDSIVSEELTRVLGNLNPSHLSKKELQFMVKNVRRRLRLLSGRFIRPGPMKKTLHLSQIERGKGYELLEEELLNLHAQVILDLGCGRNPLQLAHPLLTYYAYDINEENISEVNDFFHKQGIIGKAEVRDIRKPYDYPSGDVALLLKVVDLVDIKGHKSAEMLMARLPVTALIVSFSTKTLSGKSMNHPQRGWIEQLCRRRGWSFRMRKTSNELFYIIIKQR
jgi:hypothetical protein